MAIGRRAVLSGAASLFVSTPVLGAGVSIPRSSLRSEPAFRIWDAPAKPLHAPLAAHVVDIAGKTRPLKQWLDARPAVLILWATWCTPCLAETPDLNKAQLRLRASGARTVIRPVQAFDDRTLPEARAVLDRFGGRDLETVRASPELEAAALRIFGVSPKEKGRTSVPALMLVRADGSVAGLRLGSYDPEPGQPPYWDDPRTYRMLHKLEGA